MSKLVKFLLIFMFLIAFGLNARGLEISWGPVPGYVTMNTLAGPTGYIMVPNAFTPSQFTLALATGVMFSPFTYHPDIWVNYMPCQVNFAPFHIWEVGISKDFSFHDDASPHFVTDSTPFLIHTKLRVLRFNSGALAIGGMCDVVPDDSGAPSRGHSSFTFYSVVTGQTSLFGEFSVGIGKTFYFLHYPDFLINFYVGWLYSIKQLDDRLQFAIDFTNADYRAGHWRFKVGTEARAIANAEIRGVIIKHKVIDWTIRTGI